MNLRIFNPFICILLLCSTAAIAQPANIEVNPTYEKAPRRVSRSPRELALYLTQDASSEYQKVLNIYTWIVHNIKYDVKALGKIKTKSFSPEQTLKRKKGVCSQYSNLFVTLCHHAGVSAQEIVGYSRGATYEEDDPFFESNHSWNGVKLGSTWYLVEPTWGSGFLKRRDPWFKKTLFRWFRIPYFSSQYKFVRQPIYGYFLVAPESLLSTHLPADPSWQLVEFPISVPTFESLGWVSYPASLDSLYQRRVDSAEYKRTLDQYDFLPDLPYLQQTAEKSHVFHPQNSRLLGLSSLATAVSYEHSDGELDKKLADHQAAQVLYLLAIKQLTHHKKTARSEYGKAAQKLQAKVSTNLKQPLARRKGPVKRAERAAANVRRKRKRIQQGHLRQISRLNTRIAKGWRPFKIPRLARSASMEEVKNNLAGIEEHARQVAAYQDSATATILRIDSLTYAKQLILDASFSAYEVLTSYSIMSIFSMMDNQQGSVVSQVMHKLDSIASITEDLFAQQKNTERLIQAQKASLRKFHATIIAASKNTQKLVQLNCKLSQNQVCDAEVYEASNQTIASVYFAEIAWEEDQLTGAKQNQDIHRELAGLLKDLLKEFKLIGKVIRKYEAKKRRIINFKLKKSTYETNRLIREGQHRRKDIRKEIASLQAQLRKRQ